VPPQTVRFSAFLFAYYAHAGTFATYVSLFFAARGMSAPQIGVLLSLMQIMRIIGPNLWGWVADRSGRRVAVLRATALGALLATGGLLVADSFPGYFLVMVLLNMFTSAQAPLAEALMIGEMRGDLSNYGRIRMWGSIGFIVAVMAAGYLLDWWTVAALPWLAGAVQLGVLGASLRIRAASAPEAGQAAPALLSVLRRAEVIAFFAGSALMCGAHMALNAFYSLYLARAGYAKPVIGAMWSIGVVCEVAFFYYQAPVFRRLAARSVMLGAYGVALVRFPMIALGAASLPLLVLAQLMHAATFGAHHSSSIMTLQRWFAGPLQARGQALYMSLAFGAGGTLGGLAMSYCWEKFGPSSVYLVAALMALAAGACSWWSFRLQARVDRRLIDVS
jgi:PPP family 3-phenylpropionic acid transporter